jgi:hypothetical protein
MKLLNLGCGERYHKDWINIDFVSSGNGIIAHNLLKGIPFPDNSADAVYHSHVLEHFSKADGEKFIKECFRVLKPGGIIRIAVPDLESIADNYKKYLDLSLQGSEEAQVNYDWMMLELYDQTVRDCGGGEMGKFLTQEKVPNESFVRSRIGYFYEVVRQSLKGSMPANFFARIKKYLKDIGFIRNLHQKIKNFRVKYRTYRSLGKFRMSGEVHLWMYDRFSLARLLSRQGFKNPEVRTATTSQIANWPYYKLDAEASGEVYKPDSLFMEAVK